MNDVRLVFPSEVAERRDVARRNWVATVQGSTLDPTSKAFLTHPAILRRWWPASHTEEAVA